LGNVYHHEQVLVAASLTNDTRLVLGLSELGGTSLGL